MNWQAIYLASVFHYRDCDQLQFAVCLPYLPISDIQQNDDDDNTYDGSDENGGDADEDDNNGDGGKWWAGARVCQIAVPLLDFQKYRCYHRDEQTNARARSADTHFFV